MSYVFSALSLSRPLVDIGWDDDGWSFPIRKKRYMDEIDERFVCTICGIIESDDHCCRKNPPVCRHPCMPHHSLKFWKTMLDEFAYVNDDQPITIGPLELNSVITEFKLVQFSTYLPGTKTHVETDFWVLILKLRNTIGFRKIVRLHETDPDPWLVGIGDCHIGEEIEFVKTWYHDIMITISRVFKKFNLVKDIRILLYREYIQQFNEIKQSKIEKKLVVNEQLRKAIRQTF